MCLGLDIMHGSGKCLPFTCYETINKLLQEFSAIQGRLAFSRLSRYITTHSVRGSPGVGELVGELAQRWPKGRMNAERGRGELRMGH